MHIQINNDHPFHLAGRYKQTRRHSEIIQQAETFTMIGKGVMRTPGYVQCHAVSDGESGTINCALRDDFFAQCQRRRLRKSNDPLLPIRKTLIIQSLQVCGFVREQDDIIITGSRRENFGWINRPLMQ